VRAGGGRLPLNQYVEGVLAGDRMVLARAITLIESRLAADADKAARLLDSILPHTGKSRRVGITGVPGVGKSTFIDALGMYVTRDCGERLAVLSVDPSSPISGGSILGDKTRMERLSMEERAFIRPSPAGGHLGGVARRTRETILLCEAAGFRNVFIETVGVGQSETAVRSMSDFFLLLMLAGAGDELQGIKRGIIEMIDGMAINKADGDNQAKAERARVEYASALHLFPASGDGWTPRVLCCSALQKTGIAEIWQMVLDHEAQLVASGKLEERRTLGALQWMDDLISMGLGEMFRAEPAVAERLPALRRGVRSGRVTPLAASRELLQLFRPPHAKEK
jgi:LAO/AO transport system kinase